MYIFSVEMVTQFGDLTRFIYFKKAVVKQVPHRDAVVLVKGIIRGVIKLKFCYVF